MNNITLSGNLCKDNEIRTTGNGKFVLNNTVAVLRERKNENGEYESDFINITVWGPQADYLNKYSTKGDRVELVGRLVNKSYVNKEGNTVRDNVVEVEKIRAFKKNSRDTGVAVNDTDLPF